MGRAGGCTVIFTPNSGSHIYCPEHRTKYKRTQAGGNFKSTKVYEVRKPPQIVTTRCAFCLWTVEGDKATVLAEQRAHAEQVHGDH